MSSSPGGGVGKYDKPGNNGNKKMASHFRKWWKKKWNLSYRYMGPTEFVSESVSSGTSAYESIYEDVN